LAVARRPADRWTGVALAAPALAVVGAFFIAPLAMSAIVAFRGKGGAFTLEHFSMAFDLYTTDL
jgi:ABC-type sugar transport system permease subunit